MGFFQDIAAALRGAGLDASYAGGALRVGPLRLSAFPGRRNQFYVLGQNFTKNQQVRATQHIVRQLPKLLAAFEVREKVAATEAQCRPAITALMELGVRASVDMADDDVHEVLSLLLAYRRLKVGGIEYDRAALIDAILYSDGDRLPMAIYADWLDENGHEADAIKLRSDVEGYSEL